MATRKSQRIANRASAAAANRDPEQEWRDWAALPPELVPRVVDRLLDNDLTDLIRFRVVCRPWKDAAPDPRALGARIDHRFHPRRWIMLPGPAGGGTLRKFLNISTRKIVEIDLPALANHAVVAGSAAAPEGMLVLRDESTLVVRLLNPLTGHVVDLPSVRTLQRGGRRGGISRNFRDEHTVTAAGFADDSTVVIYFKNINKMAVARPSDARWTRVDGLRSPLLSTFTFQSRFYCIDHQALMVVNTVEARPQVVVAADLNRRLYNVNMVDNGGKLMLVCRPSQWNREMSYWRSVIILLYEVNLEEGTLLRVHDLGSQAVFTGDLGAVLLPSARYYPSVRSNTVYFRFGQSQRHFGVQRMGRRPGYYPMMEGILAKYVTCTNDE